MIELRSNRRPEGTVYTPTVPPGAAHVCRPVGTLLGMHCYDCGRRMFRQVTPSDNGSRPALTRPTATTTEEMKGQPASPRQRIEDLERDLRHLERKLAEYARSQYGRSYVGEIVETLVQARDRTKQLLKEAAV